MSDDDTPERSVPPESDASKSKKVAHLRFFKGKRGDAPLNLLKDLVTLIETGEISISGIMVAAVAERGLEHGHYFEASGLTVPEAIYLLERAKHELIVNSEEE